ncbi:MAG: DUF4252 domain-containing protein [Prevotella sp.]
MRRVVCFIAVAMVCSLALAQRTVDFASKFMDTCKGDTAIHCVTIGPKMMEQLTKHHDENRNEFIAQAIQKLKTARIIMASASGESYYDKAEQLLRKYPKRFSHTKDYHSDHAHGAFYTRQTKEGNVVELIMLHNDTTKNGLVIVNLTGDIDNEFTELLTKNFSNKK